RRVLWACLVRDFTRLRSEGQERRDRIRNSWIPDIPPFFHEHSPRRPDIDAIMDADRFVVQSDKLRGERNSQLDHASTTLHHLYERVRLEYYSTSIRSNRPYRSGNTRGHALLVPKGRQLRFTNANPTELAPTIRRPTERSLRVSAR